MGGIHSFMEGVLVEVVLHGITQLLAEEEFVSLCKKMCNEIVQEVMQYAVQCLT